MKKLKKLFGITVVISLALCVASCGNKTAPRQLADSPAPEELADSVVGIASEELWTEEAVESQVRKMYDRLNSMGKDGTVKISQLEDEFCSSYYLGLRNAISKALENATGDGQLFGDEEAFRFFAGMGTPLEIETMKVDLLTGNMAQAQVRFKGADEEIGFMRLELDMEDNQWRVKNFDQPEVFGPGGYLKMMEDFANEHGISY